LRRPLDEIAVFADPHSHVDRLLRFHHPRPFRAEPRQPSGHRRHLTNNGLATRQAQHHFIPLIAIIPQWPAWFKRRRLLTGVTRVTRALLPSEFSYYRTTVQIRKKQKGSLLTLLAQHGR
jgi:hypothetical protein